MPPKTRVPGGNLEDGGADVTMPANSLPSILIAFLVFLAQRLAGGRRGRKLEDGKMDVQRRFHVSAVVLVQTLRV